MKFVVFLSLVSLSVAQNKCLPCKCAQNTVDCSKSSVYQVVSSLPELGLDVEELSLEGQPWVTINNYSFPSIPKVQLIILQSCKLNFVHRYTFKYMPQLIEINLSFNELESLDKNIFAYNTKAVTIRLNNNKLHIIKDRTFAHQKMLTHLYLQNNDIPILTIDAFVRYPALKLLNLTQNKLEYIDSKIIQHSDDLFEVYLDYNPLKCDCKLKPLFEAIKSRKLSGINSECNKPEPLKNQPFIDLSANNFTCCINITSLLNKTSIMTHQDNVTIPCLVQAFAEPYIVWRFNNTMISPDTSSKYQINKRGINSTTFQYNLTVNNLTINDSGTYTCSAKNTGFANQTLFNLAVKPAVKPTILVPNRQYIFVDLHEENYTIPFKIFGIPKPNVTWIYRDKILKSYLQSNQSVTCNESPALEEDTYWFNLTIRKVKLKYRTEFTCSSSNFKGITNRTITLIILYPEAVKFQPTINYLQTSETNNITLTCGVKAVPKPIIQWRYGHLLIDSNIAPKKYAVQQIRDDAGTYWSKLMILQIEINEGGLYKCQANNSEEIAQQQFTIQVNKYDTSSCDTTTWRSTLAVAIGCSLLVILLVIIIIKCCVRYHVSKNWTQEYSYRGSMLST